MYTFKTKSQSVFVIKVQKEDKLVFKVIGHIFLFNFFFFYSITFFCLSNNLNEMRRDYIFSLEDRQKKEKRKSL